MSEELIKAIDENTSELVSAIYDSVNELRNIRKELAGIGALTTRLVGPPTEDRLNQEIRVEMQEETQEREAHDDLKELRQAAQAVLDAWDNILQPMTGYLTAVEATTKLRIVLDKP